MSKNVAIRLEQSDYEALLDIVGRSKGDLQNGLVRLIRERAAEKKGASPEDLRRVIEEIVKSWQMQDETWCKVVQAVRPKN